MTLTLCVWNGVCGLDCEAFSSSRRSTTRFLMYEVYWRGGPNERDFFKFSINLLTDNCSVECAHRKKSKWKVPCISRIDGAIWQHRKIFDNYNKVWPMHPLAIHFLKLFIEIWKVIKKKLTIFLFFFIKNFLKWFTNSICHTLVNH